MLTTSCDHRWGGNSCTRFCCMRNETCAHGSFRKDENIVNLMRNPYNNRYNITLCSTYRTTLYYFNSLVTTKTIRHLLSLVKHNLWSRAVEITYNVILDQDQVQAIYFDLRSDQGQIIFVIFLPIEKIKI